jgi:hypothetical protein
MTGDHWAQRVRGAAPMQELRDVRNAARDLSQQAGYIPGRTGILMQNVTQVLLLGTAVISGTLGLIHLCKALARKPNANHTDHRHEHPDAKRHPTTSRTQIHEGSSHGR